MIADTIGRAIIFLLILSPLGAFVLCNSSSIEYIRPATTAEAHDEATTSPRVVRIVTSSPAEYSYEDIPQVINGYHKPPREVVDTIVGIANEMSFNWQIVYSICVLESGCGTIMEGDGGHSLGWYHIYRENVCEYNGNRAGCIKDADRLDIHKSTRWTVKRLLANQNLGRYNMIRSHNGLYPDHRNERYVSRIEDFVAMLPS
jgi:uncharacterized protein YceK